MVASRWVWGLLGSVAILSGTGAATAQTLPSIITLEPVDLEGELTTEDKSLDDETFYDIHTFEGSKGEIVTIELSSDAFDTNLMVFDVDDNKIAENDDFGDGQNSWIAIELPATGIYKVYANSYEKGAIGSYEISWDIGTEQDLIISQASKLFDEGMTLYELETVEGYQQALNKWEDALIFYEQKQNQEKIALTSVWIGSIHSKLGYKQEALSYYKTSLAIYETLGNQEWQSNTLNDIGSVYYSLGENQQALEFYQQALSLRKVVDDRHGEAVTLNNIGAVYDVLWKKQKALDYYQQSLSILRTIDDLSGEAIALNNIGAVYSNLGKKQEALDYFQQALSLKKAVDDRSGEAATLNNIGQVYSDLGKNQEAFNYFQQALPLFREKGNRSGEATTLSNIGLIYSRLGDQQLAIDYYQQALPLTRAIGDRLGEAKILHDIGLVYHALGERQVSLNYYKQVLVLFQGMGDLQEETRTLNSIAGIYSDFGKEQEALKYYQQALALSREVGDRRGEAVLLNNIGTIYSDFGKEQEALDYYQQSLSIRMEIGDRRGEATTLNNIGLVYSDLGENKKALNYYQQALPLRLAVGDRSGEAVTLNNIGTAYSNLGDQKQALTYFQQALPLRRAVGDRSGEANTLNNIGTLFQDLDQLELAIIFYKQSVNVYEGLRNDITELSPDIQQSYLDSIADTYRRLADALLAQDRILEAQRVLDLLKVQELDDYLDNVRGNQNTETGIANRTTETIIIDGYNVLLDDAIQVGQTLAELSEIPVGERTPEQRNQIKTLRQAKEEITIEISEFFESEPVQTELAKLQRNTDGENFDLDLYAKNLKDDLAQLDNAVILYPLVLDDRLELIVISATAPPFRRTVPISRLDLNKAILKYRNDLTRPQTLHTLNTVQTSSKTLYDLLIAPLRDDLEELGTENIIYAPDGRLRYVPLAALYDGKQWLIENYNINNITAVSLTNFTDKPSGELSVLAGAFTDTTSSVAVGSRNFTFSALPDAKSEVETLATTIAGTTTRFGDDFSADIRFEVEDYNIVHLATHAKFVSGTPEESFILFNNQQKQTLKDVEKWDLTNVDLLVLSACQTALGDELGDGKEILGLGFQMQRAGAKSTIASLWYVDDGGTKVLMDNFYAVLASQPGITKAEALRKAQIALIQNTDPVTGEMTENVLNKKNLPHPYYWSPFILIGNGL